MFFSSCTNDQLVCLRHCTELCQCAPEKHTLRYRYTLDELPAMLDKLRLRTEGYDEWCEQVKQTLNAEVENKQPFPDVKALLTRALDNNFPASDLLKVINHQIIARNI